MKVNRTGFVWLLTAGAAALFAYSFISTRVRTPAPTETATVREQEPAPQGEKRPPAGAFQPPPATVATQAASQTEFIPPAMPADMEVPETPPPGAVPPPPPGARAGYPVPRPPPQEAPPPLPENLRGGPPMALPANLPKPEELREHFQLLQRFLELSPDRLARIRESIERIERMPEQRKQEMLARIRDSQSGEPGHRRMISVYAEAPDALRPRLTPVWTKLPIDTQLAIMERMQSMDKAQRQAFLEGLVLHAELQQPTGEEDPTPWATTEE